MAELAASTAARHGRRPALRFRRGADWVDTGYDELWSDVRNVGLGLLELGIEPSDHVAIISNTRPEWTIANLAILSTGAASVSVYQTNSAEECRYVLDHSGSRAAFVEDGEQLAKVRQIRRALPTLEHLVAFEPEAGALDAISLDDLRRGGEDRDAAELDARIEAVTPDDRAVLIYTSGTTGPPKGVVLSHGNFRAMTSMLAEEAISDDDTVYLFLPLAHAFAQEVQFTALDVGATIIYWERDPQKIVTNLQETRPTNFPSVPRIFEKIHTLATAAAPDPAQLRDAIELGLRMRARQRAGEPIPGELQAAFDSADRELFRNVRDFFGGRIRRAITGSAPIATEILEFFCACGVPVLEGWGLTETSAAATINRLDDFRLGSVGKLLPGEEVRIAEDGEVLLRGPNIFGEYFRNPEATAEALGDGWFHTGDIGRVDDDGFLYITGRKKELIITAGGKNISPANLENGLKQSRWISEAIVVGDRRPYLVALITLDGDQVSHFAAEHGLDLEAVPDSAQMQAAVQEQVDVVNSKVGRVAQVKRFRILPSELTQAAGELTPSLKVKRNVVQERYSSVIEGLYSAAA